MLLVVIDVNRLYYLFCWVKFRYSGEDVVFYVDAVFAAVKYLVFGYWFVIVDRYFLLLVCFCVGFYYLLLVIFLIVVFVYY